MSVYFNRSYRELQMSVYMSLYTSKPLIIVWLNLPQTIFGDGKPIDAKTIEQI